MTTAEVEATARPSIYLTFELGQSEYGVEILLVREIVAMLPITPVPGSSQTVLGVCNLRGRVIPVISLRHRFGLPPGEESPHNVIIIVEHGPTLIGLAVDRVREVATFTAAQLDAPPVIGLDINGGFVKALGRNQDRVRILLDIQRVLTLTDMATPVPETINAVTNGS